LNETAFEVVGLAAREGARRRQESAAILAFWINDPEDGIARTSYRHDRAVRAFVRILREVLPGDEVLATGQRGEFFALVLDRDAAAAADLVGAVDRAVAAANADPAVPDFYSIRSAKVLIEPGIVLDSLAEPIAALRAHGERRSSTRPAGADGRSGRARRVLLPMRKTRAPHAAAGAEREERFLAS
jgi:hypothetical protein